jgi:hypothetical protein
VVRLNQSEARVNHSKCLRNAAFAAVATLVTGLGTQAFAADIPTALLGSGLEPVYLLLQQGGPMGIAAYLAWKGSAVAQKFSWPQGPLVTITVPVTLHMAQAAEPEKKETTP